MEPLHEHNQKTYENICRMYDEGIQRVAVVQPTGSGKSLLMAKLIEDNPDSRFFVLSTSHKINDQFKEKLDEKMLERVESNIYCNMPNMNQEIMESLQPDYIFLDEMHRALAKEWSKGIKTLLEMYPNAKVLGLSATPIRYLDKCRNVVNELFGGNLACNMSLSQAILDGILPMARYVCGIYSYEKDTESLNKKIEKSTNSNEEKQELLKELKILKENLDKGHGVSDIFKKYVMSGNEKFVVFLKNTTHLRVMKPVIEKWFLDAGFTVRLYEVHCKNTDKDKAFQAFTEDKGEGIKLCLSVNMLAEGIHGDIDGVIMLRETISANMYFQMIGRAFACGKKTIPLIIDLVANSQFISDAANLSFPNELKGEIEKRKEECEKEGKEYKEYEVGFDVDEFIVMDEFMDVVSGFREIEGRLQGSWDLYIKALKQYKDREGDCLVPHKHVEMLSDGTNVPLGQWCRNIRNENNTKRGNYLLTEEMEKQLTRLGFVWDTIKYKFEKKVSEVATYYKKYGNFPSQHSENFEIRNLGIFLVNIRQDIKKDIFPEWKEMLIKKYIPEFSCENNNVAAFKRFFYYAKRYKEENGHLNIKKNDVIGDDYKIGIIFGGMRQKYKKGLFKSSEVKQLEELGLCLGGKFNKQYNEKMELAMQAANDGTIINFKNQIYNGVNLYTWIKCTIKKKFQNGELLKNERDCIERLLDVSLDNFFENIKRDRIYRPIKIVDKKENKDIAVCKTYKKVSDIMQRRFNVKVSSSVINQ